MRYSTILLFYLLGSVFGAEYVFAQVAKPDDQRISIEKISGISFAVVDGSDLKLDLYLPDEVEQAPLVVYVHGGAWRRGSRERTNLEYIVNQGYALASLDFRLSGQAKFPAQIHDIKSGIRFLRANEAEYGYDASRIAIAGGSSGGHLAALVGVTNGHSELEGAVGNYSGESSDVQAIVSFFGASNLTTILNQSTPRGLRVRVPALDLLLGAQPDEVPDIARLASPVFHLDPNDPPLMLLHGDQDPQMPINQSLELYGAYQELGLDAQLEVVYGAAHGGNLFRDSARQELVKSFLDRTIR